MNAKHEIILNLKKQNMKTKEILKKVSGMGINRRFVQRTVNRFLGSVSVKSEKKLGRKRSVRVSRNIRKVRSAISQNPARSASKLAKDMGIARSSMRRILKDDLHMKAYKKQRIHGLTEAQKKARVVRCKNLLAWHAGDEIIFSDEKMFVLQDTHNQQNDRVYGTALKNIPCDKLAVQRFQNHSAVMVWGAICPRGKLPLLFIERGVKINKEYYIQNVLENHLLPHAMELYGDNYFCFQQDGAPSHKAKVTQEWCRENLTDFIPADEWPASSPDCNPLDFSIWGYMLSKIGSTKGMNLDGFKKLLIKIWDEIPLDIVRSSCFSFFERMKKVIAAKGERFEIFD